MSKFDKKISFYKENMVSMGLPYEDELFDKITKGLGPSIFKRDAASVSTFHVDSPPKQEIAETCVNPVIFCAVKLLTKNKKLIK